MKALINKLLQWMGLAPTEKDKRATALVMSSLGKNKEYEPPKKPDEIGIYSPNYQAKVRKSPVNSSGSVYNSSSSRPAQNNSGSSIRKNEDDMIDAMTTHAMLGYCGGLATAAALSSLQSSSAASDSCYSSSSSSDSYSSCDSGSSSSSDW